MKRILVPSDLSDISENALQVAANIAEKTDAEIFLVNFTEHPVEQKSFTATGEAEKKYADEENIYTIQLVQKHQEELSLLAKKYSSTTRDIKYQVYDEGLKDGVVRFTKENDIDLIVIGTSGEESADEFFSGNHTEQVIEVATCPVIAVNSTAMIPDFNKIVLGLTTDQDKNDNFTQAARYLNDLSTSLGAEVDIVHVAEIGSKNKDVIQRELVDFASRYNIINEEITVIESDDKEEGLIEFARKSSAGLLAVFTHAEDGFFRIFRSSLSEELSMTSDVPVLIINLHNI